MTYSIEEIQSELQMLFKGNRYAHTLGVQYTSICLAMKYGEDLKKAELAGLLHDCAKQLPENTMIEICKKHQESISDIEYLQPFLLHGKAGACIAHDKFNICDPDILNAIRFHTTGRPDMTLLEKIVFVADYIEPYRTKAAHLDELRRSAFENIDLTVLMILNQTLEYLTTTDSVIDQQTVLTRDYYSELLRSSSHE